MTRVRFLNRRQVARTPPAAVVSCGLTVAAVDAGPITCINTRNKFRAITHARPLPDAPAMTTSESVTTSIRFASVRRQYQ